MKIVLWGKIIYVVAISSFCFCFFHLINTMEMHFEIILSKCVVISLSKPSSFCGCFGFDKQTNKKMINEMAAGFYILKK